MLIGDVGPEVEQAGGVVRLPEVVEESALLAPKFEGVRSLYPGQRRRIGQQGVAEVRIHATLVEQVGVGLIELEHRHARKPVGLQDAREADAGEVGIIGDAGRDRKVQAKAARVQKPRTDGPVVIGDGVVDIGLVQKRIMDESFAVRIDRVQPAVAQTHVVVVVEIVVPSDVELVGRIAGCDVSAKIVVVGPRIALHVGFGNICQQVLGDWIEHAAGYPVVGEWRAVAVGVDRERVVNSHRSQIAVGIESVGLGEITATLQVRWHSSDGLRTADVVLPLVIEEEEGLVPLDGA